MKTKQKHSNKKYDSGVSKSYSNAQIGVHRAIEPAANYSEDRPRQYVGHFSRLEVGLQY